MRRRTLQGVGLYRVGLVALMGMFLTLGCGVEGTEGGDGLEGIEEKADAHTDVSALKEQIIQLTQTPLAYIANGLGYGWASGCRGNVVGEDMYRINQPDGTVTVAANSRDCIDFGEKWDDRLKIHYRDWQAVIENMQVYKQNVQKTDPLFLAEYIVYNNTDHQMDRTVSHTGSFAEALALSTTLCNSRTDSFGIAVGVSAKIATVPFFAEMGLSLTTAYNAAWTRSFAESTTRQDTGTFSGTDSVKITIPPRSKQVIRGYIFRKAYNMNFYAQVRLVPAATLEGFMRREASCGNWHREHRGSGDRKDVSVTWGNPSVGLNFIDDMINKSRNNQDVFDWTGALGCTDQTGIRWGVEQLENIHAKDKTRGKFQGSFKFEKGLSFTMVASNPVKLTAQEKKDLDQGIFEVQIR